MFFNGDIDSIAEDNPEIALNRDGTLDQSKTGSTWRASSAVGGLQPAAFQKRAFPFRIDGVLAPDSW